MLRCTHSDLAFDCTCSDKEVYPAWGDCIEKNCENWLKLQVEYTGELIIKWNPILNIFVEQGIIL